MRVDLLHGPRERAVVWFRGELQDENSNAESLNRVMPGKIFLASLRRPSLAIAMLLSAVLVTTQTPLAASSTNSQSAPIPLDQLGALAGKQYQGDGLSVTATPDGARLRCVFQRLEGQATSEGLWLTSTAENAKRARFRVVAVALGRTAEERSAAMCEESVASFLDSLTGCGWVSNHGCIPLANVGKVHVAGQTAQFIRPDLTEEYSVSVDGVRQDFIIEHPPLGAGELRVELNVAGAKAEPLVNCARLVLNGSGRRIAYNRLRVTDVRGQELVARVEVADGTRLAVVVDDAAAVYPVRIDPTFSDADWVSLNPGVQGADGYVFAIVADGNGNVYFGGDFTFMGTVPANRIAKWNGSTWSAVGSGIAGGYDGTVVSALAVSGTNLYAGGNFWIAGGVSANYIAKWDGGTWSALGSGMGGVSRPAVHSLAVSGNDLYAGGEFTTAGGVSANYIAKWDGGAWSALESGMSGFSSPSVYALAVIGTDLYAGGNFQTAGGVSAYYIAKWNGSAWSQVGGMNGYVSALAASGTNLYAGGMFTTANSVTVNAIAKWNGSTWSALGSGMNSSVNALAASGNNLYAGGLFTTAGGVTVSNIAKWNGNAWSALGSGMDYDVSAVAVSGTNLYAGGYFSKAGGGPANHIAKWNGSAWSALGPGLDDRVHALVVEGTNLYAGGDFKTAGGVLANWLAKWNSSAWSALGLGIGGNNPIDAYGFPSVHALAVSGTNLYVGGNFTNAGGVMANRVAKWNGSAWSALGSGMNGAVGALAVSGNDLYAGGNFTTAGGTTVNYIAKWNGSAWSALGSGMNLSVSALAVIETNLYAGGWFTTAGGGAAKYIAKWNGSAWSALKSGMNGYVYALAASGTNLYAAGEFFTAGGVSANYIARWNGTNWSALGSGMDDYVYALAVSGRDLYAGGEFTRAGGVTAKYIAKWNGNVWSVLGSGMDGRYASIRVDAMASDGAGHLFVGGNFYLAGTTVSPFIAQANLIPQRGLIQNIGVSSGAVAVDCLGLPGTAYAVERATDVMFTADRTTLLTTNAPAPDGLFRCTDSSPPSATAFYRLHRQ